jgi:hypothetical protein
MCLACKTTQFRQSTTESNGMESGVLLCVISDNYYLSYVAVLHWVEGIKISRDMTDGFRYHVS